MAAMFALKDAGFAVDRLDGDQAFRMANGELVAREAAGRIALAEALNAASGGDEALGAKEPSIVFRAGIDKTLTGTVMALKDGLRRKAASRYRALAALCLREASSQAPIVAPAIAELYNLTPREMTVRATLIENAGVPKVADTRIVRGDGKKPPEIHFPKDRRNPLGRSDQAGRRRSKRVSVKQRIRSACREGVFAIEPQLSAFVEQVMKSHW